MHVQPHSCYFQGVRGRANLRAPNAHSGWDFTERNCTFTGNASELGQVMTMQCTEYLYVCRVVPCSVLHTTIKVSVWFCSYFCCMRSPSSRVNRIAVERDAFVTV
eukprot:scpid86635/ scgid7201/ 